MYRHLSTSKTLKVANIAGKWGVGAISVGTTTASIWDNNMNYDSNIAFKRNMVVVTNGIFGSYMVIN
jgi:hypothetical protein